RPANGNVVDARTADPPDRAHWGRRNSLNVRREHMGRGVGIDRGTTNSEVAGLGGGDPHVHANAHGSRTTPPGDALHQHRAALHRPSSLATRTATRWSVRSPSAMP